ncbi:MAG: hypothetical protein B6226_00485 [Candidatus Cloacimonetes bacterium 4572_65]|nr:MAG: hypothetical protein B6226_00485 [Candidatus Cloacimonetes bacterium 4572_65]
MKKITVLIVLLLTALNLFAINMVVEQIGDSSLIVLRIDSSKLHSKKGQFSYRVILEVVDDSNKMVLFNKRDIQFSKKDIVGDGTIIEFFEIDFIEGDYTAFVKINNKIRRDKKHEKFEFKLEGKGSVSSLYQVSKSAKAKFEIPQLNSSTELQNIYLYQFLAKEADSLFFVSSSQDSEKRTKLEPSKTLQIQLQKRLFVEGFKSYWVEAYIDGKRYKRSAMSYEVLHEFQREYGWEIQLKQIKYIVTNAEWEKINKNKSFSDKERVLAFWERNNPSPNSKENELQNLFYGRISKADRLYSVHKYRAGWQTDRGRIFVKFGQPDEIEVDNYPIGSFATQTWHYYSLQKVFHFYDKSRIEDYKLYNREEEYDY